MPGLCVCAITMSPQSLQAHFPLSIKCVSAEHTNKLKSLMCCAACVTFFYVHNQKNILKRGSKIQCWNGFGTLGWLNTHNQAQEGAVSTYEACLVFVHSTHGESDFKESAVRKEGGFYFILLLRAEQSIEVWEPVIALLMIAGWQKSAAGWKTSLRRG